MSQQFWPPRSVLSLFTLDPPWMYLTMFLPTWTYITTMWGSIATKAIIRLHLIAVIFFHPKASLATTHCFKSRTILKNWPKINVCLLSNSCWVISSKINKKLVIPIAMIFPIYLVELVNLIALINLVDPIKLVGPIDSIGPIKLVGLIDWFLIFEPKLLVKLALIKVCILAPSIPFGGLFCCMSLIASSNERWNFSSFC